MRESQQEVYISTSIKHTSTGECIHAYIHDIICTCITNTHTDFRNDWFRYVFLCLWTATYQFFVNFRVYIRVLPRHRLFVVIVVWTVCSIGGEGSFAEEYAHTTVHRTVRSIAKNRCNGIIRIWNVTGLDPLYTPLECSWFSFMVLVRYAFWNA